MFMHFLCLVYSPIHPIVFRCMGIPVNCLLKLLFLPVCMKHLNRFSLNLELWIFAKVCHCIKVFIKTTEMTRTLQMYFHSEVSEGKFPVCVGYRWEVKLWQKLQNCYTAYISFSHSEHDGCHSKFCSRIRLQIRFFIMCSWDIKWRLCMCSRSIARRMKKKKTTISPIHSTGTKELCTCCLINDLSTWCFTWLLPDLSPFVCQIQNPNSGLPEHAHLSHADIVICDTLI